MRLPAVLCSVVVLCVMPPAACRVLVGDVAVVVVVGEAASKVE